MGKPTDRIPPSLKHGLYSGIGLLPTEDPAEFDKFKQAVFDELTPVGQVEEGIVDHIGPGGGKTCSRIAWQIEHGIDSARFMPN